MKQINKIFVGLNRRWVLPGYFPTLHFRQDHHQIHHHKVDRGCRLLLLHHCLLRYGKEENLCDGMDNSLGNVEVTVFAMVIRAERFEMIHPLALETYTTSHIQGKDFVNEQGWNLIGKRGGQCPKGRSRR
jgi:hypothetical protein